MWSRLDGPCILFHWGEEERNGGFIGHAYLINSQTSHFAHVPAHVMVESTNTKLESEGSTKHRGTTEEGQPREYSFSIASR